MKKINLLRNVVCYLMACFLFVSTGYGQDCVPSGKNEIRIPKLIEIGNIRIEDDGIRKYNLIKEELKVEEGKISLSIKTEYKDVLYYAAYAYNSTDKEGWKEIKAGRFFQSLETNFILPELCIDIIRLKVGTRSIKGACNGRYRQLNQIFDFKIKPLRCIGTTKLINTKNNLTTLQSTKKSQKISSYSISPNPNTGNFKIHFELQQRELVKMTIMDSFGKSILINSSMYYEGENTIVFNDIPSGVYYALIQTKSYSKALKMIVLK